jgi:hypothetical protein
MLAHRACAVRSESGIQDEYSMVPAPRIPDRQTADIVARLTGQALSDRLDQQFLVENL